MANIAELQQLADKLASLETTIKNLDIKTDNGVSKDKGKKSRNMTDAGALHKAKLIYYQENKNSNEVKDALKGNVSFQNWRVAKEVTDKMFDNLPQSKKDEYVKKAHSKQDEL